MFILPSGFRKRSTNVSGTFTCPWCSSPKMKLRFNIPPDRQAYECKVCHKRCTYVTTPMPIDDRARMKREEEHPYKHIKYGNAAPRNIGSILTKIPLIGKKIIPIIGKK